MSRPKKEDKQKKAHKLTVHVNDLDYALIKKKAQTTNLPMSEFFRQAAFKISISVPDPNLVRLLSELSKIGANLNQITKQINATGVNLSDKQKSGLNALKLSIDEIKKAVLK
jgi:hypothetical protein